MDCTTSRLNQHISDWLIVVAEGLKLIKLITDYHVTALFQRAAFANKHYNYLMFTEK